jgi:hypothetical protein
MSAAWQPSFGMPAATLLVGCTGSLPTYTFVGGFVQKHGQNIETLAVSIRRQNQI